MLVQEVTNVEMSRMVAQLEVFSSKHANERTLLAGLVFNDNIPDDFPWKVDADILNAVGYADVQYNLDKEIQECLDMFFTIYYDCELYHDGNGNDIVDPMDDLGMTLQQYNIMKDVCREQFILGLNDTIGCLCSEPEITDWVFDYLDNK